MAVEAYWTRTAYSVLVLVFVVVLQVRGCCSNYMQLLITLCFHKSAIPQAIPSHPKPPQASSVLKPLTKASDSFLRADGVPESPSQWLFVGTTSHGLT